MNQRLSKHVLSFSTLCAFVLLGAGSIDSSKLNNSGSKAKASVTNLTGGHDMGIFNGNPDYGIRVSFTLSNIGESGEITVSPWVSCSEGEWSKSQTLVLEAGQSMDLTYFFEQPTVNSTNVQYGVKYR